MKFRVARDFASMGGTRARTRYLDIHVFVSNLLLIVLPVGACNAGGPAPFEREEPVHLSARAISRTTADGQRTLEYPRGTFDGWITTTVSRRFGQGGNEQFAFDRVAGALWLRSGILVIGNAGSRELLFIDTAGVLISTIGGGARSAPSFRSLEVVASVGRTAVFVFEPIAGEASIFDQRGDLIDRFSLSEVWESRARTARPFGISGDGLIYALARSPGVSNNAKRPLIDVVRIERGDGIDTIAGRLMGGEVLTYSFPGVGSILVDPLFRRDTYVGYGNSTLAYLDNEGPNVAILTDSGSMVLSLDLPNLPVTSGAVAREIDAMSGRGRILPGHVQDFLRSSAPRTMPAFGGLHVDNDGHVWVKQYATTDSATWWLFDAGGRLMGAMRLPASSRITDAGSGYIVTVSEVDHRDVVELRRLSSVDMLPLDESDDT